MSNNTLANVLSTIFNNEKQGKSECASSSNSKLIRIVLNLLKKNAYIQDFKLIEDGKGGILNIKLTGTINKCGAITPRFSIKKDNYEKFEKRYLPAKNFGILIVTTPHGIMTHKDAIEKGLGGRLIAYCY